MVIAEYQFGLMGLKRRNRLQSLFQQLEAASLVLCPDRKTADICASIRFELKRKGRPIPEGDLWIASLARQHDLEIASQDAHFDAVDGAQRIGW